MRANLASTTFITIKIRKTAACMSIGIIASVLSRCAFSGIALDRLLKSGQ